MHKTHIFDRPTYPIFFQTVTGNKQHFFLGLTGIETVPDSMAHGKIAGLSTGRHGVQS